MKLPYVLLLLFLNFACYAEDKATQASGNSLGSFANPVKCDGPEDEWEYLGRHFGPDGAPPE